MDTENLNKKVKKKPITLETLKIRNQELRIKNRELTKEIERLNQELYNINEKIPATKTALRVNDIVYKYSIAKSTVWLYAQEGYITPIKNSSRVTTFDAEEVELFFIERNNQAMDITPNKSNTDSTYKKAKEKAQLQNPRMLAKKKMKSKISPKTPLNKSPLK